MAIVATFLLLGKGILVMYFYIIYYTDMLYICSWCLLKVMIVKTIQKNVNADIEVFLCFYWRICFVTAQDVGLLFL